MRLVIPRDFWPTEYEISVVPTDPPCRICRIYQMDGRSNSERGRASFAEIHSTHPISAYIFFSLLVFGSHQFTDTLFGVTGISG